MFPLLSGMLKLALWLSLSGDDRIGWKIFYERILSFVPYFLSDSDFKKIDKALPTNTKHLAAVRTWIQSYCRPSRPQADVLTHSKRKNVQITGSIPAFHWNSGDTLWLPTPLNTQPCIKIPFLSRRRPVRGCGRPGGSPPRPRPAASRGGAPLLLCLVSSWPRVVLEVRDQRAGAVNSHRTPLRPPRLVRLSEFHVPLNCVASSAIGFRC